MRCSNPQAPLHDCAVDAQRDFPPRWILNLLYATIFGQNPVGLSYQFADKVDKDSFEREWEKWHLTEDEVAFLQRIAWETVQEYQAQQ